MAAALSVAALVLAPSPGAARERISGSWDLGVSALYAYMVRNNVSEPKGGGVQVFLHYHITDAVGLRAAGLWTAHGVSETDNEPAGTLHVFSGTAGLNYALDLTRFVPTLEFGLGVMHRRQDDWASTDMAFEIGLAVDYTVYPWLLVGAGFRYHAFITDISTIPVYVELGPRVAFRWR